MARFETFMIHWKLTNCSNTPQASSTTDSRAIMLVFRDQLLLCLSSMQWRSKITSFWKTVLLQALLKLLRVLTTNTSPWVRNSSHLTPNKSSQSNNSAMLQMRYPMSTSAKGCLISTYLESKELFTSSIVRKITAVSTLSVRIISLKKPKSIK